MKSDFFVSVVMVVDRHTINLEENLRQIQADLDARYSDYEIVLIAQASLLRSKPGLGMDKVLANLPCIRLIQLSSTVHDDIAWAAGLENAIGDFVVFFDPRRDPVAVISDVVQASKSGFDVVVGVAAQSTTVAYRIMRVGANLALRAADYNLPKNSTGLRCLSRRAVNAVTSTGRFHQQIYMRIQKTGYPTRSYEYQCQPGYAVKKSLMEGFREFVRLLVFNSSRPLRWMSEIGLVGSLVAFLFSIYSIVVHFFKHNVVEGWTTTILFMSMLFMLQFMMLAFFGEYLIRLLDDRSEQADYSVVFEKNSAIMVNADRVNVLTDSESIEANNVQTGRNR